MSDFPSGTVTFLFTDIEGSTELWERDRTVMAAAVDRHLALMRSAVEGHSGVLFKVVGDAVQAAFSTAPDALAAALAAQRALTVEPWPGLAQPLRVRMALHTAAAQPRDGDYLAAGLNRLARLLAAAHGSQVLVSLSAQELARDALPAGTTLRDLGEHPLRDLYRPERVFQILHPDLPADFPPLNTLASRPNNLPLQPTPFLGRDEPVAWLVDVQRRDEVRLVTITGPGGVGKTRLALQVAADLLESFPDGVWFVDLSALTDAALVVPTMGATLGMREGAVTAERLAASLGSKRVLLVLDNFERVVEATPDIAEVLAQAPGVKVLVTSRTPLHAYGEREYPLAPLPLPDPARLPSLERLNQYEAVRLFIERAQAVKPDFTVTSTNAPAVAEICSRLDGLPLAIELAAARVKVLPPQALLKRLEQRLPLLTGGARTAPVRQQTMHNAIAWSYDLLSPEEQTVFRRLTVFAGGCTIDAAEAAASAGEALDVFTVIATLVDESLLRQEEGSEGEPRFRMLETVREYGLEQLDARGEGDETRNRLAAWFVALAEQVEPDRFGGDIAPEWVIRLEEELPNLRAAITWLLARGDATRALRLLTALEDFWIQLHTSDAQLHRWLEAALAAAPEAPGRDRVRALWLLSMGNGALGQDEAALHHAQRLLDTAEELADPAVLGFAHLALAFAWEARGDLARVTEAYAEVIPLWQMADGFDGLALCVQAELADKRILQGDLATGVPILEEALRRLRRHPGPPWSIVRVIALRGYAALLQDDISLAARVFVESIERARSRHQTMEALGAMAGLAGVALGRSQAERSALLLGAIEAAQASVGIRRIIFPFHVERITAETQAALPAAAFEKAWAAGRAMSLEEAVAEALAVANDVVAGARG